MANTQSNQSQKDDGKKWLRYVFFMVSCVTTGAVAIGGIYGIVSTTYHAPPGGSGSGTSKSQQECIEDCLEDFGISSSITGPCKYDGKGYGGISKGKIDPIVKYLASKGYTKIAIAGIIGNWVQESGLEPNNCQNSCEDRFGGDNESCAYKETDRPDNKQCGYGLAQWTYGTRKDLMIQYNQQDGRALSDLGFQLDFFNYEADNNYPSLKTEINKDTTPEEATYTFEEIYEGAGVPAYSNRVDAANAIYKDINCDSSGDIQPIQKEGKEEGEETAEEPDSSFSGRRIIAGVPYMNQGDYKPNLPEDGCGITSGSMLSLFYVGKTENDKRANKDKVDPNNFVDDPGYKIQPGIKKYSGLESIDVKMGSTPIDTYIDSIVKLINKQIPVIIFTGYNLKEQLAAGLEPYGHIMVITGYIADEKGQLTHMVVNDPYNNYYTQNNNGQNAEYPIGDFKKNLTETQHQEGTHYYYVNKPGNGGYQPSSFPGDYDPSQTPEEYCKEKCKNVGGAVDQECVNLVLEIANDPDKYNITTNETLNVGDSCCAGFSSRVYHKAYELGANLDPSILSESTTDWAPNFATYCPAGDPNGDPFSLDATCDKDGKDIGTLIANESDLVPGDLVLWHNTYQHSTGITFTHIGILAEDGHSVYDCSGTTYRRKTRTLDSFDFAQGRRLCKTVATTTGVYDEECGNLIANIAANPSENNIQESWFANKKDKDSKYSCCAEYASTVINEAIAQGAQVHPSYQSMLDSGCHISEMNSRKTTQWTPCWVDNCNPPAEQCDDEGYEVGIKIDKVEDLLPGDIITFSDNPNDYQNGTFTHTGIIGPDGKTVYDCSGGDIREASTIESHGAFAQGRRICLSGGANSVNCNNSDNELKQKIQTILDNNSSVVNSYGIFAINNNNQACVDINGSSQKRSASTIKAAVMLKYLDENGVPSGNIDSDIRKMIRDSDNPSSNAMIDEVGGFNAINTYLQTKGLTGSSLGRKFNPATKPQSISTDPNILTAQDTAKIFMLIDNLPSDTKNYANNELKSSNHNENVPSDLFNSGKIGHKVGGLDKDSYGETVNSSGGFIEINSGKIYYGILIHAKGKDWDPSDKVISDIIQTIYDHFNQ